MCQDRGYRVHVVHAGPRRSARYVKRANARLYRGCGAALLNEGEALVRVFLAVCLRVRQERAVENFVETNAGVVTGVRQDPLVVVARYVLRVLRKSFAVQFCGR